MTPDEKQFLFTAAWMFARHGCSARARNVLEAAGSSLDNVVKTVCFLADMGDFAAFNAVYGKYFTSKPARSCVAVKSLPKNVLVEVEVIAEA